MRKVLVLGIIVLCVGIALAGSTVAILDWMDYDCYGSLVAILD